MDRKRIEEKKLTNKYIKEIHFTSKIKIISM